MKALADILVGIAVREMKEGPTPMNWPRAVDAAAGPESRKDLSGAEYEDCTQT